MNQINGERLAEILEISLRMLEKYPLCDNCLGRQFALLGFGLDNCERGRAIKTLLAMSAHEMALSKERKVKMKGIAVLKLLATHGSFRVAADLLRRMRRRVGEGEKCFLCEGQFDNIQVLIDKILENLREYEYDNFLVGIKLPLMIEEHEDEFKAEFGVQYGESMKNEFSRVIGKELAQRTGKKAEYLKPQIVILVNPFTKEVKIQSNSLFIAGRYRKLMRGIPQSKWICIKCGGKGCERCNWTGKIYPESVEELIAKPILDRTSGEETAFHAAGREDRDARMLGRGRPFVIEIKKPKKRKLDLKELEEAINEYAKGKVEVLNLRYADRNTVRKLKGMEDAQKIYRVIVKFDREITDEEIAKLEKELTDTTIYQRTPIRVLHRRSDRLREKHIYETKIKRLSNDSIEMKIRCQGGLYVKELVTGDEGRTSPSVSEIINAKATPMELDVLNVLAKKVI
ncbi:MAG TPA: tRNA pseudouridine(54/55) synthase Pus10 [Candidatus Bathyarchaeota archaeon]|nr:tRNA pseudouridine(54/55) synthase Pus10 [Candidatus Bathyarchaeota archaeon]